MRHVRKAVDIGLGLSRCVEEEARDYWDDLDEIERFRLDRGLDIGTATAFVEACVELAAEIRLTRASEQCQTARFFRRERCV